MVVLRVNDNANVRCPICWEETSTEVYQRIKSVHEPNLLKVFAAILNMDFQELARSNSEDLEIALYQIASYVFNQPEYFRNTPVPVGMKIRGQLVMVPKKLERMTLEQNLFLRAKINQGDVLEQHIALACAVYLQPLVTGAEFDTDEVMRLKAEIEQMPIEETFPVGFFFLKQLVTFGLSGSALLLLSRLMRWMRRLQNRRKWTSLDSGRT